MVTKSPSDFINLISNFDPASGGQKRELENIIRKKMKSFNFDPETIDKEI